MSKMVLLLLPPLISNKTALALQDNLIVVSLKWQHAWVGVSDSICPQLAVNILSLCVF